jgi:hypothetical protein
MGRIQNRVIKMVKCGIKKYDELPAVIGWVDIDALRYSLLKAEKDLKNAIERKTEITYMLEFQCERAAEKK